MKYNNIIVGPSEIINLMNQIDDNKRELDKRSKFHVGQLVKVTLSIDKIINVLTPAYNRSDARMHARDLMGASVMIIGIDILTDEEGTPGTYYSIELDDGRFYVMPEDLLFER